MSIIEVLTLSATIWIFVLLVLLFVWALKPRSKPEKKIVVREDLNEIKKQINGE